MTKELTKLKQYCKTNKVEINISPDGIGIWAEVYKTDFTISAIKPDDVPAAVEALVAFRKTAWRPN